MSEGILNKAYDRTCIRLSTQISVYRLLYPPNGVMKYQLLIPLTPVVPNTGVLVNNYGIDVKLSKPGSGCESTLTGA